MLKREEPEDNPNEDSTEDEGAEERKRQLRELRRRRVDLIERERRVKALEKKNEDLIRKASTVKHNHTPTISFDRYVIHGCIYFEK